MSDIGYRRKDYSDIRYNVGLCTLQSDIGRSDIRLSPISLITDIGMSAHLCLFSITNFDTIWTTYAAHWRNSFTRFSTLGNLYKSVPIGPCSTTKKFYKFIPHNSQPWLASRRDLQKTKEKLSYQQCFVHRVKLCDVTHSQSQWSLLSVPRVPPSAFAVRITLKSFLKTVLARTYSILTWNIVFINKFRIYSITQMN